MSSRAYSGRTTYGRNPIYLALLISSVIFLWWREHNPDFVLAIIFPRSLVKRLKISDSRKSGVLFSLQKKHSAFTFILLFVVVFFLSLAIKVVYYLLFITYYFFVRTIINALKRYIVRINFFSLLWLASLP